MRNGLKASVGPATRCSVLEIWRRRTGEMRAPGVKAKRVVANEFAVQSRKCPVLANEFPARPEKIPVPSARELGCKYLMLDLILGSEIEDRAEISSLPC